MSGSYFREPRNVELSLLYSLETQLASDWIGVTVVKSFKEVYAKNINIPIVCIILDETASKKLEVGANTLDNRYLITIDIFARSNGQRLDLSAYIKDKLKDGWIHYNHSHESGDNSALVRTVNGRDSVVEFVTDSRIELSQNIDEKDKFRHNISIIVKAS